MRNFTFSEYILHYHTMKLLQVRRIEFKHLVNHLAQIYNKRFNQAKLAACIL